MSVLIRNAELSTSGSCVGRICLTASGRRLLFSLRDQVMCSQPLYICFLDGVTTFSGLSFIVYNICSTINRNIIIIYLCPVTFYGVDYAEYYAVQLRMLQNRYRPSSFKNHAGLLHQRRCTYSQNHMLWYNENCCKTSWGKRHEMEYTIILI